jgi:hypothetical protein
VPYIKKEDRRRVFGPGCEHGHATTGELNYAITEMCREYMMLHGLSYQTINDIVGALEGAKLEFSRRVAAPYEDKKIKENGDVY